MDWRPRNRPCLVVGAIALALDDDLLANAQERQEDVNVHVVVSQVADIDLRGASLGGVVPKNVTVAGIAGGRTRVGAVKEQVGGCARSASRTSRTGDCGIRASGACRPSRTSDRRRSTRSSSRPSWPSGTSNCRIRARRPCRPSRPYAALRSRGACPARWTRWPVTRGSRGAYISVNARRPRTSRGSGGADGPLRAGGAGDSRGVSRRPGTARGSSAARWPGRPSDGRRCARGSSAAGGASGALISRGALCARGACRAGR